MTPMDAFEKSRVMLASGSGFLGQLLVQEFERRKCPTIILSRSPRPDRMANGDSQQVKWDGKTAGEWFRLLEGAEAVINLTGRSVNCLHTPKNQSEIIESRVNSVRAIGEGIQHCARPPRVWIQAGSLAIYGDAGDRVCDETTPPGEGFTTDVCTQWEKAFDEAKTPQTRKVLLRIGLVLGSRGGFIEPLINLTACFLGGTIGSGRQYISWLHAEDFNRIVFRAIEDDSFDGVYNATGPNSVTNAEFMRELRRVMHRPWLPPTPVWAVRLGARLIGTEASLALTGRRCIPKRLTEAGFDFHFPELRKALEQIAPC